MKKRISAFLMALIMMFTVMPVQNKIVKAEESESQSIEFTLKDSEGKLLSNTKVDCSVKVDLDKKSSVEQKLGVVTTNEEGKGVISVTDKEIINALLSDSDIEIEYVVKADGYSAEKFCEKYKKSNADLILTARKAYFITVNSKYDESHGIVEVNGAKKNANEPVPTSEGSNVSIKVIPNDGYMVSQVKLNGQEQKIANPITVNEFSLSDIKENQYIEVSFVKYYTVTLTANGNGSISVNSDVDNAGGTVTSYIAGNGNAVVKATPNEHYRIVSVKVNGKDTDFTSHIQNGSYSNEFKNIKEDYNVVVTFALVTNNVSITTTGAGYVLHNGTTVGSGSIIQVEYGKSADLYLRPEIKYFVEGIYINGGTENKVSELVVSKDEKAYIYRINEVTADMSIKVVFKTTKESDKKVKCDGVDGIYTISYEKNGVCDNYMDNGTMVIVVKKNTKVTIRPANKYLNICLLDMNSSDGSIFAEEYGCIVNEKNSMYFKDAISVSRGCATDYSTTPVRIIADTEVENVSIAETQHVYYKNFTLSVNAKDTMTGLKKVSYWVTDDKDEKNNTVGSAGAPICLYQNTGGIEAEKNLSITVPVDETKNNTRYVKVHVVAEDMADNSKTIVFDAMVNTKQPSVEVKMDDKKPTTENYYKYSSRVATVIVKDKDYSFSADCLVTAIADKLSKNGKKVSADEVRGMVSLKEQKTDETGITTFTYKVSFDSDAHYVWELADLKNLADNKVSEVKSTKSENPFDFYVDDVAPEIETKMTDNLSWYEEILMSISFGDFINYDVTMTAEAKDAVSEPVVVTYYKQKITDMDASNEYLTYDELENLYKNNKFVSEPYTTKKSEAVCIYARAQDKAGNVSYVNSHGIIIDSKPVDIEINPEKAGKNGFYNGDVRVSIRATEEEENKVASGLVSVEYKVWIYEPGQDVSSDVDYENIAPEAVTQSGVLVSDCEAGDDFEGEIVVLAENNNSNNVAVSVKAVDKAGNLTVKTVALQIDATSPVINISYDNNNPSFGKCYNKNRIATIEVIERNFNAKDIKFDLAHVGGSAPVVSDWSVEYGDGNGDGTKHIATISYTEDGDYTFGVSYSDLAENNATEINYAEGTKDATEFTIDKTAPIVSVSYNNNDVKNGKYFAKARTATISIKEHNFDTGLVSIVNTNGSDVVWKSEGDTHTGTVTFQTDGACMFDVSMKDKAGNESQAVDYGASASPKEFIIDQKIEKPTITGVENGVSYRDEVKPKVSFSDENYDSVKIELLRTRANQKNVDVTDEFLSGISTSQTGCESRFDTIKKELENDGIYTLNVQVMDLAGNKESKSIRFTLNRFGSVYMFNEYLVSLQNSYTREIKDDLVITEYNADPVIEDSLKIEITCDGSPIQDVEYKTIDLGQESSVGESGWYEYEYTIDKCNFEKDGVYRISVATEDIVGNKPENANYDENYISFCVDTTPAEITRIEGLDSKVVKANSKKISFDAFDSIGIKKIDVFVDGKNVKSIDKFSNNINVTESFEIKDGANQHVRFVIEDLAGNITDTDEKNKSGKYVFNPSYDFNRDVTVSTEFWVQVQAFKIPILVTAGTAVAIGGIVGATTFFRRRKKVNTK